MQSNIFLINFSFFVIIYYVNDFFDRFFIVFFHKNMYMDEFKIPIGCNIISNRESFGYNFRLMKYVVKPHTTSSLFQNNNINHCVRYSFTNNN